VKQRKFRQGTSYFDGSPRKAEVEPSAPKPPPPPPKRQRPPHVCYLPEPRELLPGKSSVKVVGVMSDAAPEIFAEWFAGGERDAA
jgi:hypothetical protein